MASNGGPRLALALVRLVSRMAPRGTRADWLREWEAELLHRWDDVSARRKPGLRDRMDLLARAAGSVVDAMRLEARGWRMEGIFQDVRMAARRLLRRPGFSAVIVLTLAVGIGVNTAIFSIARDVLLRPFPYPDADNVVAVSDLSVEREGFAGNVSYPNIADVDALATSFVAVGAARWSQPALEDDRGSIVLRGSVVTGNYFSILGVDAGLGRFFRPDEEGDGREPLVVLGHALWRDRFGSDPGVVGRQIRLSGVAYTVIGVTGADFEDPWILGGPGQEPQLWTTVASPPSEWPRSGRSWRGIARVRPDVTLESARDELDAVFAGLAEEYPEANARRVMTLTPLRERIAGPARPVLLTLLASVGILLVIACANLANLLLGRALDQQEALAMHRALGASTWRILGQGIVEAGLLAGVGCALGLAVAASLGGVARGVSFLLPRPVTGQLDAGVLSFALLVSAGCAFLFGVAPALHTARSGGTRPGVDAGRAHTAGRRARSLRRGLVVTELALTASLLVGAGLLVRSFHRLGAVDLGMRTDGVVSVELHGSAWWELEPDAAQAQWDRVLEAVRAVPGVSDAGAIDYVPLGDGYSCDGIQPTDQPPPGPGEGRCAEVRVVLPGTLGALGVPLLRGRFLSRADGADAPDVAVVDARMAETFWPGEDPIGKRFRVHTEVAEVVGVVGDMRHFGPGGVVRPMVYLHAPQEAWNGIARGLALVVRGTDPASLVDPIRRAVTGVNRSIAIGSVATLEDLLHRSLSAPRFRTDLMAGFGLTALLLAILGIAGVLSHSVARRTRELGVRLALGARPVDVTRLVVREGLRMTVVGVGAGLAVAYAASGSIEALLFQVSAHDPWVYGAVALTLGATAIVACYLPGRRAGAVDPVRALNRE